jgi:hypothetical protein
MVPREFGERPRITREDLLARDGFDNWELLREVLKAFPQRKGGEKFK